MESIIAQDSIHLSMSFGLFVNACTSSLTPVRQQLKYLKKSCRRMNARMNERSKFKMGAWYSSAYKKFTSCGRSEGAVLRNISKFSIDIFNIEWTPWYWSRNPNIQKYMHVLVHRPWWNVYGNRRCFFVNNFTWNKWNQINFFHVIIWRVLLSRLLVELFDWALRK